MSGDDLATDWHAQRRAILLALSWYAAPARDLARAAGIPDTVTGQRIGGILRSLVGAGLAQADDGALIDRGGRRVYWTTVARDLAAEVLA